PADSLAAPPAVVRLHRALGDATRLKILKLLASRDLYLTEIAQQLALSKPTIKHHLALLRSAGLVTITESGTVMYYSLRRNRLDDASAEIKRFLIGYPGPDPAHRAAAGAAAPLWRHKLDNRLTIERWVHRP